MIKSGISKRNLLLAATIVGLSSAMPMAVAETATLYDAFNDSGLGSYVLKSTDVLQTQDLGKPASEGNRNFIIDGNNLDLDGDNQYAGIDTQSGSLILQNLNSMQNFYKTSETADVYGGAIYNSTAFNYITSGETQGPVELAVNFINNQVYSKSKSVYGGAIAIKGSGAKTGNITGDFVLNKASVKDSAYKLVYGGAIFNNNSVIESITSAADGQGFYQNSVEGLNSTVKGGAIFNYEQIKKIKSVFRENKAVSSNQAYGGAIFNQYKIGQIEADFYDNSAGEAGGVSSSRGKGGAIANDYYNSEPIIGDYNSSTGTFADTYAIKGNFVRNSAGQGGAIYNKAGGKIGNIEGNFEDNFAYNYGGAVFNEGNGSIIGVITGDFTENAAGGESDNTLSAYGGAVYNNSNAKINGIKGNFEENGISIKYGNSDGGAIYNFQAEIGDITGNFINNYVYTASYSGDSNGKNARGGAIFNGTSSYTPAKIGAIKGDFTGNSAESGESGYIMGGAVYNGPSAEITSITASDKGFTGNYAKYAEGGTNAYSAGGAIANIFSGTGTNAGKIGDITADFTGNYAASSSMGAAGGAVFNGQNYSVSDTAAVNLNAQIGNITGDFKNNYVLAGKSTSIYAYGGAIFNGGTIGNITASKDGFVNNSVSFGGNYSTNVSRGGAIFNAGTMGDIKADFINNKAESNGLSYSGGYGGAIYNAGTLGAIIDSSFIGNTAQTSGGAIYNDSAANGLNITAQSKDVEFSGNRTINSYGAAIYDISSEGTTLNAAGGNIIFKNNNYTGTAGGSGVGIQTSNLTLSSSDSHYISLSDRMNISGLTSLNGGTVKLSGDALSNKFNSVKVNENSAIDLSNNGSASDNMRIGKLSSDNKTLTLNVDYDGTVNYGDYGYMDKLTVDNTEGTPIIDLNNINITQDGEATKALFLEYNGSNITIANSDVAKEIASSGGYTYTFTHDGTTKGLLNISRIEHQYDLPKLIADSTLGINQYSITTNDYKPFQIAKEGSDPAEYYSALGTLDGASREFTISGGSATSMRSIDGTTMESAKGDGVTVGSGRTLNLRNISQFKNFTTAVDNAGTLNVEGVTFTGNTTDINNTATLNLSGDNTISIISDEETPTGVTNIKSGTTTISDNGTFNQKSVNLKGGRLALGSNVTVSELTSSADNLSTQKITDSSVDTYGGALYNKGTITALNGDFKGNGIESTGNAAGGAISNVGGTISSISSNFINNYITQTENDKQAYGGAIHNIKNGSTAGSIGDITGNFENNHVISTATGVQGGAIYNFNSSIGNIVGNFTKNTAESRVDSTASHSNAYGGAISTTDGVIGDITGNFTSNKAITTKPGEEGAFGGAIYSYGWNGTSQIGDITGKFKTNEAKSGGAIFNSNNSTINSIAAASSFENNTAINYGGAIYNKGTIKSLNADFIGNNITTTENAHGGAISNDGGKINSITGNFTGNYISLTENERQAYGGAIHNISSGEIGDIVGNFKNNSVTATTTGVMGGAIYNVGSTIGDITGNFTDNVAKSQTDANASHSNAYGGAIAASMSSKIGNITGNFTENKAITTDPTQTGALGGAIYNADYSEIGNISGKFEANEAISGAAIFNSNYADKIGNILEGSSFVNNKGVYDGAITNYSKIGNITADFIGNNLKADGVHDKQFLGSAIANISNAAIDDIQGTFNGNYIELTNAQGTNRIYGGAIYNAGTIGTSEGGIVNSIIQNNYIKTNGEGQAYGGAIATLNSINLIDTDVINNYIDAVNGNAAGGAIYALHGINITAKEKTVTISGNHGTEKGSAIYNESWNATNPVVLNATGGNIIFEKNDLKGDGTGTGYGISSKGGLTVNTTGENYVSLNDNLYIEGATTLSGLLKLGERAGEATLNEVVFSNSTSTLDLNNSKAQTLNVSSISGNAKINIDIDFTGDSVIADAINLTSGGTSVLTINSITALDSDSAIKTFDNLAILTGTTGNVTIKLADTFATDTRFNGEETEKTTRTVSTYKDSVTFGEFANDEFTNTTYAHKVSNQLSVVDGTKLTYTDTETVPEYEKSATTQDVLQALNQSTNAARSLTTDSATAVYTVGDDLGTTGAGTLTVEGVLGSELNLNGKTGFELTNAGTVLNLKNLTITALANKTTSLLGIANETGTKANLENITVSQAITKDVITNLGELNFSGTNAINSYIGGTGTTNINGGKTTVASITQNAVNITAGELEVANITATNEISNEGTLTLTGTANANTISGTGHTTIAGNVNNTGAINQAITVNGTKTLTTAANLIGGTVTNGGKVELTGGALGQTITGGNITIASGEVTSTVANLGGDITNDATLNLSGTLNKNIAGAEGITKLADNMTFADGAGVAGTLNFNGKAITMSGDNKTSTFNIGKINSDGTINIDVNTSGTPVYDVINLTAAGSTGTITINSITEIGSRGNEFTLNILQGKTGGLQLALSDAVHSQFDQAQQHNLYYVSDAYDATIDFDKTSFNTAEWDKVTQKAISIEDNTKIKYAASVISDTATGVVTQKDALAFINQNTDTSAAADRSMVTTDTNKTYTAQEDLGTTGAGTLLVQGKNDGTTKLDMNNHSGFVVSNSGTTVTLKDINVDNVQNSDGALVNITNTGSSATLDGATVNVKDNPENKANVISSNGSVTVKDSTVNAEINNTGTLDFEGTSQADRVAGATGTTNVKGQTTLGSLVQKLVNIVTGGKLIANGDVTTGTSTGEGVNNAVANGLELKNGTLTGNVTGSGSTDFKGTSAIADGSKVGQAITIDGKLTTLADGLGGAVTNSGEVDLTGGTLKTSITGGTAAISGTNVSVDDTNGSIASAVKVETGAKLTANASNVTGAINNGGNLDLTGGDIKNAISGDGNTTISGTVTNTTGSAIGNAVTVASTGNLTTAADKLGGTVTNGGTVQLNGGTLSQTITGGTLNIEDSVLTSADNLKADTTTVTASKDLTLNGGNLTKDITGSGNTKIAGTVTNSANIQTATEITSGSLDNTNGQLANVTITSGSLKSDASKVGAVTNNGTYEITGGTISSAISGTGAVNITGNTTNNAVNTTTGAVSVAAGKELAVGTSGDAFASASSVTMGNNSTLNIQNGAATNAVMDNLIIATGDNVNVKMDWNDTLNSSSGNINGGLTVTDINMASSTSSYEAVSYAFTNLGEKIALSNPVNLSGVTDSTNNFVSYNSATGNLTSFRNSLLRAVDKTEAGQTAAYVMTGDETAGGQELDGALKVQGDGHTINTAGIKVGSSTITNADLTLENTNMNVAGKAIEVFGGNKVTVDANGQDITLTTTDNSEVVSLNKGTAAFANAELKGANTINITGGIVSDDINNVLTIAAGSTVNHAGLLDPLTTEVNGTYNRTSGYDAGITFNVNNGGVLKYSNDTTLYDSGFHDGSTGHELNTMNLNGGTLDTRNGAAADFQLANFNVNANSNVMLDVDLANKKMDNFDNSIISVTPGAKLNISALNLISDALSDNTQVKFTSNANLINNVNYTGSAVLTALSPIYKYNVSYDDTDGANGYFNFARFSSGGHNDFNPAILPTPIAAQLGGYLIQLNSYDEAFRNMDMYMLMTKDQRQAMKLRNKYAKLCTDCSPVSESRNHDSVSEVMTDASENNFKTADLNAAPVYDDTKAISENAAGWFRPFVNFESVGLKNGPKVKNNIYGTFAGFDSGITELGNGWDGMWGIYAGYNGSHQHYDGIGIYQNGGTLGLTGMLYKDNFFTGLTANVGANAANASTMYGNEDFAMLMTGAALKTGYNWELAEGKFIIQPNYQMSYSMVNTFDYTNSAGVRVKSDPLHAITFEPGVKFIGNLPNGWQPYAGVSVVWNVLDKTDVKANDVSLPNMSVKPFVKYGVGVRKTWGERLTGFIQTFITNGGRNGIGFQAGFKWFLGKENPSKAKKSQNKMPEKEQTKITLKNIK